MKLSFVQVGCGDYANYAGLTHSDWADHFNLPGIPKETEWHGLLVDMQPSSAVEMLKQHWRNPRLLILNAGVSGQASFQMTESREPKSMDPETRLIDAAAYNDKPRPNFCLSFLTHTLTLDTVLAWASEEQEIGLVALDVQGSEVEILESYKWSVEPLLFEVEAHSEEALDIVSEIMSKRGYRFVRCRPDGRRRVNHLWQRQS